MTRLFKKRPFGGWKSLEEKKAYNKKYYLKNREEALLYQRQYRLDNLEKTRETNRKYRLKHRILKEYGLTQEQYLKMKEDQKNCCLICKKHESILTKKLNIDHCHKTKKVRGLLCNTCNRGLGYFYDSVENLKAALEYLNVNT